MALSARVRCCMLPALPAGPTTEKRPPSARNRTKRSGNRPRHPSDARPARRVGRLRAGDRRSGIHRPQAWPARRAARLPRPADDRRGCLRGLAGAAVPIAGRRPREPSVHPDRGQEAVPAGLPAAARWLSRCRRLNQGRWFGLLLQGHWPSLERTPGDAPARRGGLRG